MRLLERYTGGIILSSILVVLLIVVGLDVVGKLTTEIEKLEGAYTFSEILIYVFFTTPSRLVEFLPMSTLIGCLAGLGILANSSELVVMRAAGIPTSRLLWLVLRPTILLMVLAVLTMQYVVPYAEQYGASRRAIVQYGEAKSFVQRGFWNREGEEFMHFNAVEPNGILHGVSLYRFNGENQLVSTLFARRATYQGDHWVLERIVETRLFADRTERDQYNTYKWHPNLSPELLRIIVTEPDKLSVSGLWSYSEYLADQGLNNNDYKLAFWRKVLQPLETTGLVLVAIAFVFGPLRDATMGFRVFTGVLVGIAFNTSQDLLGPASVVYGFSPILAVLIPILICMLVGIVLLRRAV